MTDFYAKITHNYLLVQLPFLVEVMMITISLCMIVKNEESVLERCLESIKDAADEIIILDTGSTDKTKEIAGRYTDMVYDFEWVNDFSAARNKAYSKATKDYQMWLDADDVLPEKSLKQLLKLKNTLDPAVDIVTMKYITHFDEQNNPILTSTRERLTKRSMGYLWLDPVHECIPLVGNVFYTNIEIHHRQEKREGVSYRNINIYENLEKSGSPLTPRQQYYYARELKDHGNWEKAAHYFEIFLESGKGWLEDNIATCYNLSICYRVLKKEEKILPILIKSFNYDTPRAEVCSELGYYYKRALRYKQALDWFQVAANLAAPNSSGFILRDYWGYIPYIESCVCSCYLGDYKSAREYNEKAAAYKHTAAIDINREFLASKLTK